MSTIKHQIHYASLEVKNIYGKQFTTVTTHKNVQNYYNEKRTMARIRGKDIH